MPTLLQWIWRHRAVVFGTVLGFALAGATTYTVKQALEFDAGLGIPPGPWNPEPRMADEPISSPNGRVAVEERR